MTNIPPDLEHAALADILEIATAQLRDVTRAFPSLSTAERANQINNATGFSGEIRNIDATTCSNRVKLPHAYLACVITAVEERL